MTREQWLSTDFIGAPDYEVSDLGRVRRVVPPGRGRNARKALPYYMKASWSGSEGRKSLRLYLRGLGPIQLAHLVAIAFVGPRPDGPLGASWVFHRDGDPANCAASNLKWRTDKRQGRYLRPVNETKRLTSCRTETS